ncbi:MAG: hypothetical protein GQ569_06595 [Methylococcaceae bacterium]|nr:hypothetical protein [Methylococcaceae bacterium]
MNNSQFRAIPKSNNFNIPFKLKEEALLDWLSELSRHDGQEACLQVLRLLQSLNKEHISATKRISFLSTITEHLKGYVNQLEQVCWDVGFPLTADDKVYAEAVTWNYLALSQGFFIAAQDSNKKEAAFALALALKSIAKAQLHIAAIYAIADDGFWNAIYKMYRMAENKGLLKIKVKAFKNTTVEAMFTKLFVFHACDTNQFRARDMHTIFYFLDNVCHNIPIEKQADKEKASFVFCLDQDNPPAANKKKTDNESKATCYFSPVIVAYEIYDILKKGNLWTGTLKSINNALFLRVIKTLSQGQKRKYTRLDEGYEALGVIGFENIINFLRKNKADTAKIVSENHAKNEAQVELKPNDLKVFIEHEQLGSIGGNNDVDYDYQLSENSIWQTEKKADDIKDVVIEKIQIFDSSAKGYSIYWNDSKEKAKIGDVFGIISKDKKRLEIALIRRIAMNLEDEFKFGAEVIGFESDIVYICRPPSKDECTWAIFIPGIKALKQADTLIFSMGSFQPGHRVSIYKGEQKIQGLLVKELHSTSGIVMVELAYPEPTVKQKDDTD